MDPGTAGDGGVHGVPDVQPDHGVSGCTAGC